MSDEKHKAILFDFDGTLASTMEDHWAAWKAVMSEYGVKIKPDDYYLIEGVPVHELPNRFCQKHNLKGPSKEDSAELVRKKEKYYLNNHHFTLYPGVESLVDRLRFKNIRMAVVTAGLIERLKASVPSGFLEKFNAIVTGEDTKEGKPSPAPYIRGAEKLGVSLKDCIVIENAPLGIESAKKAGAYCIALCTTLSRNYLNGADEVVRSFENLNQSETIKRLIE